MTDEECKEVLTNMNKCKVNPAIKEWILDNMPEYTINFIQARLFDRLNPPPVFPSPNLFKENDNV